MQMNSFPVFVERVHGICFCPEASGDEAWRTESLGNIQSGIRQFPGMMRIDANFLPNPLGEDGYDFLPRRTRVLCDQQSAADGILKREQALDDGIRFGLLNRLDAHSEASLFKEFSELCQATSSDRPNRTSRHAQLVGDFLVRPRGKLKEKQADHLLALFRQLGNSVAEHLFLLELCQHALGKIVGIGSEPSCAVRALRFELHQSIGGALVAETLVIASLHQPFRKRTMVAEPRQLRKQVHTHRLKNVRSILVHTKLDWD